MVGGNEHGHRDESCKRGSEPELAGHGLSAGALDQVAVPGKSSPPPLFLLSLSLMASGVRREVA